jgi:rhamnose utilization protein RhaD (predicted bifunctional aldolase and dehydrogenase)/NAD(P)-dependent dehydrogenase (short-subunit alcohol dehydrogenase family)
MKNRWSNEDASSFMALYRDVYGADRSALAYVSGLLGAERELVLHGGGNTSVKGTYVDIFGERRASLCIKGSGCDMAGITPASFCSLDLDSLLRLRSLQKLSDQDLQNQLRTRLLDAASPVPSIETLAHAFLPGRYILHSHADAVLTLSNQRNGRAKLREALGPAVIILEYHRPGYELAHASAEAFEAAKDACGMVWSNHGLITWAEEAQEAYEQMIALVTRAEEFAAAHRRPSAQVLCGVSAQLAAERMLQIAPVVRGVFVRRGSRSGAILLSVASDQVLGAMDSPAGRDLLVSPPLTTDHLIRVKPLPAWIDPPDWQDITAITKQIRTTLAQYETDYLAYVTRHTDGTQIKPYSPLPHLVFIRGAGVLAVGPDLRGAEITRDIAVQTVAAKVNIEAMGGTYESIPECALFHMEYDAFQRSKLESHQLRPMSGRTALVTGAAGAIGAGICEELLQQGCAVAAGDVNKERLQELVDEFRPPYGAQIAAVPFDVTDPDQVADAFSHVIALWGGVDLVVINAGVAHVARLLDLDLQTFRKLESVNVEGTLNMLSHAAAHFRRQDSGGDIVFISTKNVFAPSAGFGAYSATKAAAHQLARIASLEMAELDVRVNMVAPDAVFSHGPRRSGLWITVGPDRMRARGLDETGLEQYYQNRNLLKVRVEAKHVANAVVYFATRLTPTTGATMPVDGGLPDATPR